MLVWYYKTITSTLFRGW